VIEVRQYIDRLGRNPFERWFEGLDDYAQARITVALDRVERGNFSAAKGVGAGVSSCVWISGQDIASISARTAKHL
jgi:putative component of toxin-antitoxin plasmid stabilization module